MGDLLLYLERPLFGTMGLDSNRSTQKNAFLFCFSSQQLPAENHNKSWQTLSADLPIKFLAEKAECPAGNGKVWMW